MINYIKNFFKKRKERKEVMRKAFNQEMEDWSDMITYYDRYYKKEIK
jgi:hypothetical protein